MPPLESRTIDVGQGRAIFQCCVHLAPQQWPNYRDQDRCSMMPVKATRWC